MQYDPTDLEAPQPLARFLIVLFRAFEEEVLHRLAAQGYRDIAPTHLNALRHVSTSGSRMVDMARHAGITKQAMHKTVSDLETKGYLLVGMDQEDRRARLVRFSKKGEKLLLCLIAVIGDIEQEYEKVLGARGLSSMRNAAKKLVTHHRNHP